MNTEALRARLAAIRADVDAALAELAEAPGAEPSRMRIGEYAASRGIGYRTMFDLIREGLPVVGMGARRRVLVREADEWYAGPRGRRAHRKEAVGG